LPTTEISPNDLTDEELLPHFFTPDFLRPQPFLEGADQVDDEDFDDAYWLVPGLCPEPYWDLNLGKELDYREMKRVF
jgi:hypothetical protein